MTIGEAKTLLPRLEGPIFVKEYPHLQFRVSLTPDKAKVDGLSVTYPAARRGELLVNWGPGKDGSDVEKKPKTFWFNPEKHVRAVVTPALTRAEETLTLENYYPTADFLGDRATERMGFEAPLAILGATSDQLKTAYSANYVEDEHVSPDAAHRIYLDFPPTEFDPNPARIIPRFDVGGKVKSFRTAISYGDFVPAKETILEAIKTKLGAFTLANTYGASGEPTMIFGKDGSTRVKNDVNISAWVIEREPKRR